MGMNSQMSLNKHQNVSYMNAEVF